MNDTELWEAAWWSAVAEPADPCARVLRQALGDRDARAWLIGSWSEPPPLARHARIDWRAQWNRWRHRALSVDIDSELTRVARAGGGFMTPGDPRWPDHLACLGEDEPMGLWFLGDLAEGPRTDRHLSIVGARASTGAGNRCARNMAAFVAAAGVTVVSGGAIGIDIEAHRGALSARGRTICILAGGVCNPYPACHGGEFRAVIDGGGALISEVAPTARPAKWRFLTRNRLIAAWSGATVVVEAGARSGAALMLWNRPSVGCGKRFRGMLLHRLKRLALLRHCRATKSATRSWIYRLQA